MSRVPPTLLLPSPLPASVVDIFLLSLILSLILSLSYALSLTSFQHPVFLQSVHSQLSLLNIVFARFSTGFSSSESKNSFDHYLENIKN